jgi:hypothetical protein
VPAFREGEVAKRSENRETSRQTSAQEIRVKINRGREQCVLSTKVPCAEQKVYQGATTYIM